MIRTVLALVLSLLLAHTGQQIAVMKGQPIAVGEVVLCSGGQVMSVPVDKDGNPTGPAHFCPDCMAAAFAAVLPGQAEVARDIHTSRVGYATDTAVPVALVHIRASARGPPSVL